MGRIFKCVAFCVGVMALGSITQADAMYDSWAKIKIGTVVKYKQLTTTAGTSGAAEITETLKEVTPAAATIEMKIAMTAGGITTALPTRTIIVQVGVPTPPVTTAPTGSPANANQTREDVVVDGKTYSCMVSNGTLDQNGMKMVYKTWMCDQVPGELVKTESSTTGAIMSSASQTLTGIETK